VKILGNVNPNRKREKQVRPKFPPVQRALR